MKKIYINEMYSAAENIVSSLEEAGIACELKINACEGKFPYFTFSELWLAKDEDYNLAVSLIVKNRAGPG